MFGGFCVYVDDKVLATVCDSAAFIKRSTADDLLVGWAHLAPAYPGAKPSWKLPANCLEDEPERVRAVLIAVASQLPARRRTSESQCQAR